MNHQQKSETIAGKLEITIKINELPNPLTVENNWKRFSVDCNGQIVSVTVKPKVWRKLEDAQTNFPMWVAEIAGTMGSNRGGFILSNPNIQVFERKAKLSKEP